MPNFLKYALLKLPFLRYNGNFLFYNIIKIGHAPSAHPTKINCINFATAIHHSISHLFQSSPSAFSDLTPCKTYCAFHMAFCEQPIYQSAATSFPIISRLSLFLYLHLQYILNLPSNRFSKLSSRGYRNIKLLFLLYPSTISSPASGLCSFRTILLYLPMLFFPFL